MFAPARKVFLDVLKRNRKKIAEFLKKKANKAEMWKKAKEYLKNDEKVLENADNAKDVFDKLKKNIDASVPIEVVPSSENTCVAVAVVPRALGGNPKWLLGGVVATLGVLGVATLLWYTKRNRGGDDKEGKNDDNPGGGDDKKEEKNDDNPGGGDDNPGGGDDKKEEKNDDNP